MDEVEYQDLLRNAIHEFSGLFGPPTALFAFLLRCFFPVFAVVTPALAVMLDAALGATLSAFRGCAAWSASMS